MTVKAPITDPANHREYFEEARSTISNSPLTISELCYLRDTIEQRLTEARDEIHLFTVGDRQREEQRRQFSILCQALELDSVGVLRVRPERDNGEIKWTLYDRCLQVYAVLVLRATDDTWQIRPMPISERKRSIMTDKQRKDTAELEAFSLKMALETQGIDTKGWKLAS